MQGFTLRAVDVLPFSVNSYMNPQTIRMRNECLPYTTSTLYTSVQCSNGNDIETKAE